MLKLLATKNSHFIRKIALASLLLCLTVGAHAVENDTDKFSITIDSAYFDFASSNRSLFRMTDDILNADNAIFHRLDRWAQQKYEDPAKARRRSFAMGLLTSGYLALNLQFTLHEYGHWNRDKMIGKDFGFNGRSDRVPIFFLQGLLDPGSLFESDWGEDGSYKFSVHPDGWGFLNSRPEEAFDGSDWDILSTAAGFTHDAKLASRYADRLYNKEAIPTGVFGYTLAKIFPYLYTKGSYLDDDDTTLLAKYYQLRGWDIDESDIGNASLTSLLLSASTYAYFKGAYDYLSDRKTALSGYEYKGFRLPEVEAYFDRGISYKLVSGYRVNDRVQIPFAIERVVRGDKQTEYTVGMNWQLSPALSTKSSLLFGEKLQGAVELSYQTSKHYDFYVGAEYNNLRNLEGMRNIINLKDGITENRLYAGLVFSF